ncbi:hypothetical protein GUJ93_ZPchr0013g36899 [Zizania palustris]|uniref:TF-B3 domain-containing protein n=1 Tax=Zizania palustris TaxID=103762 RepID=A0A8J5X4F4_ZIZPA|nr:hypothetical protein GUJ93_ZPchr0013g36899 [Zizania palustris]
MQMEPKLRARRGGAKSGHAEAGGGCLLRCKRRWWWGWTDEWMAPAALGVSLSPACPSGGVQRHVHTPSSAATRCCVGHVAPAWAWAPARPAGWPFRARPAPAAACIASVLGCFARSGEPCIYPDAWMNPPGRQSQPAYQNEMAVEKTTPTLGPTPARSAVRSFCKTLTAFDTSPHGGFSVLRRHVDECLPPLSPPTQELVAKDLHGMDWRFRHIFRGQPRRHLLQSGWSVFVSSKRLVAGDAFIFLRGENGELCVDVRRAMRQLSNVPSSVISSQSMHFGVLATKWHAINTKRMFTVYYKPRRRGTRAEVYWYYSWQ